MKFGYRGKILKVDLTERSFSVQDLCEEDAIRFLGGAGLNAWLLYQSLKPSNDAMNPENDLIFGAGPMVGTPFPTSARSTFTAISPLTGIFGDSNGGGFFGVMVKRAGYDHFIVRGVSEKPCYLIISPNKECRIEDAADIWGKDTLETDTILKQKHPKATVASIGPAGENGVRYAGISSNRNINSFSRAGMGAVMGAKKLKAIVVYGAENIAVENPKALNTISTSIKQCTKQYPLPRIFTKYGTPMFINIVESLGLMYGENWRRKIKNNDINLLDIAAFYDAVESKSHGCFRCPLRCGKHWRIKQGPYQGEEGYKYEVAYIMTLGLTLGLRDIPTILHLVNKLNRAGLDINEFCGTLGMATDAFKKGILNKCTIDGLNLDWGNSEALEAAIDLIANREGFGDVLAEGTKRAGDIIGMGAEKYALNMKGMHWPAHSAPPFVMAFSVSTRGGDFLKAIPHLLLQPTNKEICSKLFGAVPDTMNIYSHHAKGRAVWWHENYKLLIDSLGICFYLGLSLLPHGRLFPENLAAAYRAATGIETDGQGLLKSAERSGQVQRAINTIQGLDRKNDTFTKRPELDSWAQGIDLNRPGMLDEYYAYRGLSSQGLPTQARLKDVELNDIAYDLEEMEFLNRDSGQEYYMPLKEIIRNPSEKDIKKDLKAKIQNKIRERVMAKLTEDPVKFRDHIRKVGRRRQRKERKHAV